MPLPTRPAVGSWPATYSVMTWAISSSWVRVSPSSSAWIEVGQDVVVVPPPLRATSSSRNAYMSSMSARSSSRSSGSMTGSSDRAMQFTQ